MRFYSVDKIIITFDEVNLEYFNHIANPETISKTIVEYELSSNIKQDFIKSGLLIAEGSIIIDGCKARLIVISSINSKSIGTLLVFEPRADMNERYERYLNTIIKFEKMRPNKKI